MKMPMEALKIINTLNNAGFEAYIVGGCVRDEILGIAPKDWDITTSALPEQVKELFPHTVDTGLKHGTVTIVENKTNFEVTTYRIDGEYADFRHPEEVIFTQNLKEDLRRRDFTMNAIAYCDSDGFMDFFDGIGDIKRKIIKGVGSPSKRFNEDALRMLRAVRFSAQLDFDIEDNTYKAIKENAHLIKNVSAERIREELFKLIMSDFPERLVQLIDSGLSEYVLPIINIPDRKELDLLLMAIKKSTKDLSVRLGILFNFISAKEAEKVLKDLKSDNKTIKEVTVIVEYCKKDLQDDRRQTRYILSEIGEELYKKVLNALFYIYYAKGNLVLCKTCDNIFDEIDETIRKAHCFSLKTLELNGNILKANGIENGKEIGNILKKALKYVLDEPSQNKKEILISKINEWRG